MKSFDIVKLQLLEVVLEVTKCLESDITRQIFKILTWYLFLIQLFTKRPYPRINFLRTLDFVTKIWLQRRECIFLSFSSFVSTFFHLGLLSRNLYGTMMSDFWILLLDFPILGSICHMLEFTIPPSLLKWRLLFGAERIALSFSLPSIAPL